MAKKQKQNLFDFIDDAPDSVLNIDEAIANDNDKVKKVSPFDFLKTINETKQNLMEANPECEKDYIPYIVNRGLSLFPDTIFYANEMNFWSKYLSNKMQYEFYLQVIPKRKRFSKWPKKLELENIIKYIMMDYKCNQQRAIEVLQLLSEDEKQQIIKEHENYGVQKNEQ